MVAVVLPMVIDVYQIVAEECSVANPQKVGKIDEKSEKRNKNYLTTLL